MIAACVKLLGIRLACWACMTGRQVQDLRRKGDTEMKAPSLIAIGRGRNGRQSMSA